MYEEIKTAIKNGRNIFITGSAGTGKSYILGKLREEFDLEVTATTGAAAVNVSGTTIHSFAGLGIGDMEAQDLIYRMKQENIMRVKYCRILAVDEISMFDRHMMNLLNDMLKLIKQSQEPFGGMQMIFIGDFLQLPPVCEKGNYEFAFESEAWAEANLQYFLLEKVYRQNDINFLDILARARNGGMTFEDMQKLSKWCEDQNAVHLFARNKDADSHNFDMLRKIPGRNYIYTAQDYGNQKGIDQLAKHSLVPQELFVKIGARVMCLYNLDIEAGIVNGAMGTVKSAYDDSVDVLFDNGVERSVSRMRHPEIRVNKEVIAWREQLPLRLSWAISIHKSQGMTLNKVKIDMAGIFEYGQAYVALSRATTIDNLFVRNLKGDMVKAHPKAVEFIKGLN